MEFKNPKEWTNEEGKKIFAVEYIEEEGIVLAKAYDHIDLDQLIECHKYMLTILELNNCHKLIHDGKYFANEINKIKIWLINEFKPRAIDIGLKKWAIVSEGNIGFTLVVDTYLKFRKKEEGDYDIRIFDSERKAIRWIHKE